jgi:hypothetical protein
MRNYTVDDLGILMEEYLKEYRFDEDSRSYLFRKDADHPLSFVEWLTKKDDASIDLGGKSPKNKCDKHGFKHLWKEDECYDDGFRSSYYEFRTAQCVNCRLRRRLLLVQPEIRRWNYFTPDWYLHKEDNA